MLHTVCTHSLIHFDCFPQSAPPSVRLESFTPGGYGPEKSKQLPLHRRCWNACTDCCQPRTSSPETSTTYYEDSYNDLPWSCQFGTSDEDGIWLNRNDPAGSIMCLLVWVLIGYSSWTVTFLAQTGGIAVHWALVYGWLTSLTLACHVKTTLTDPGSVPEAAVPTDVQRRMHSKLSMCSQCQTFKPPLSHHCRICNRCISRMDHHCPW